MKGFQGRLAVVTGGAGGIGYAMAERSARKGMRIVLGVNLWGVTHPELAGAVTSRHEDLLSGGPPMATLG